MKNELQPTKFQIILKILIIHLFLIFTSYMIVSFLSNIVVSSVYLTNLLPENLNTFTDDQLKKFQAKAITELKTEMSSDPELLNQKYMKFILKEANWLLFVNSLLWGIAFILPAYYILKKYNKLEGANLSDPFSLKILLVGFNFGLLISASIFILQIILQNFHIVILPNSFQKELSLNLKGNPLLLMWSVYTIGILTGILEETYFRGFLLKNYIQEKQKYIGLGITSAIFGAAHYSADSSIFIPFLLMYVGVIFGYLYIRYNNIWVPIIAHATYNSVSLILSYFFGDKMI